MSKVLTANEISEAWLTFVNDTFMMEYGCNRVSVVDEYKRLDDGGQLMQTREAGRSETDELIGKILRTEKQSLSAMYSNINTRELALVHDRVTLGTQLLVSFVQQDIRINTDGVTSLNDFFRQILLQRPEV